MRDGVKAKAAQRLGKPLCTETLADLGRAYIGRVFDYVGKTEPAVWLMVVDHALADRVAAAFAVQTVFGMHDAGLDCRRSDDRLERRAGLEGIADRTVARHFGCGKPAFRR